MREALNPHFVSIAGVYFPHLCICTSCDDVLTVALFSTQLWANQGSTSPSTTHLHTTCQPALDGTALHQAHCIQSLFRAGRCLAAVCG